MSSQTSARPALLTTDVAGEPSNLGGRKVRATVVQGLLFVATSFAILALAVLVIDISRSGAPWLSLDFLTNAPSRKPEQAGIRPAILGSIWVVSLTALFAFPVGIGAAIYLEEYAPNNRWTKILRVNLANLAGVPSVVYGLLGLGIFVQVLGFGRSILSGSLSLSLLILPIIIIASQEAVRAVPPSLRQAAYALGATKWQVTRDHVLPAAAPGVLTGIILAMSSAVGETAPLLVAGAAAYVTFDPNGIMSKYTVLPMQIFEWARRPQHEFQELAAAAIMVLLAFLLVMNGTAIYLRNRFSKKMRW
jgi:phosphate transport system permease protein